jgi:hypothetical protein
MDLEVWAAIRLFLLSKAMGAVNKAFSRLLVRLAGLETRGWMGIVRSRWGLWAKAVMGSMGVEVEVEAAGEEDGGEAITELFPCWTYWLKQGVHGVDLDKILAEIWQIT